MRVLTGVLVLAALVIGATCAVLVRIASAAGLLPRRIRFARNGPGDAVHAARGLRSQNRMPTRMGMKSQ
jgi:hypothetical protein